MRQCEDGPWRLAIDMIDARNLQKWTERLSHDLAGEGVRRKDGREGGEKREGGLIEKTGHAGPA